MNLIFLGPPGSGKGTQAAIAAKKGGFLHLSTGDLLRAAVKAGTPLGREAKGFMDRGALVPDALILALVEEVLAGGRAAKGFLLDGFPRTRVQAEGLEEMLKRRATRLDAVVVFAIPDGEILRRLTGRRTCRACGDPYHVEHRQPKIPDRCDKCGGELFQRDDDRSETIQNRLEVYHAQTGELIPYYRDRARVIELDATRPVDVVHAEMAKRLWSF
ncbi:MAG: adenylate kinase [Planctomycetota bacterium]